MRTLLLLSFLFIFFNLSAQAPIDSLIQVAQDEGQTDSVRMHAYHAAANYYRGQNNLDSIQYFTEKLLVIAERNEENWFVAPALLLLGELSFVRADYPAALTYFQRSKEIYKKLDHASGIAEVMRTMGNMYFRQGDFAKALEAYEQSLAAWEEAEQPIQTVITLLSIGNAHRELQNFEAGIEYLDRALSILKEGDPPPVWAMVLDAMGNLYQSKGDYAQSMDYYFRTLKIYDEINNPIGTASTSHNIALVYRKQGEFDQAITYHRRVLEIAEAHQDEYRTGISLTSLAIILTEQEDYEAALGFAERSLVFQEENGRTGEAARLLSLIGEIHQGLGDNKQALAYFQRSLQIPEASDIILSHTHGDMANIFYDQSAYAKARFHGEKALQFAGDDKSEESRQSKIQAAEGLYRTYKALGNTPKALQMYEVYIQTRDSLEYQRNTEENQRSLYRFEYQQKALEDSLAFVQQQAATEISYQQELAQRNYLLFGGLGLALIMGLGYYFWQQRRLREKEISYQKEMLNSTILTQENERQRIAKDLHDTVGAKLSVMNLFLHQLTQRAPKAKEDIQDLLGVVGDTLDTTRRISHDLLPPTLESFGLATALDELISQWGQTDGPGIDLKAEGERPKDIDPLIELNLFRIIQELLNNTLKYAQAKSVHIRLVQSPEKFILQYEDDGKGFDPNLPENQKGLGMQNLRSRLQMIDGRMDLQSAPERGVRVQVEVGV